MEGLDPSFWIDSFHLTDRGKRVFAEEKKAVQQLSKVKPITAVITNAIKALAADDAALARTAISEVSCGTDSQCTQNLARANDSMLDGDKDLAKGKYDNAIEDYLKAWKYAMRARSQNVGSDDDDDDDCEGHH